MNNTYGSKWIHFDVFSIVLTILLLMILGLGVKIEIVWSLVYFLIPLFIVVSLFNLVLGAVYLFLIKQSVHPYFLAAKTMFFGLSGLTLFCMGNCFALEDINKITVLFIVFNFLIYFSCNRLLNKHKNIFALSQRRTISLYVATLVVSFGLSLALWPYFTALVLIMLGFVFKLLSSVGQ